ncbi:MAG: glycosyltransferase [Sulfuricella sp.]|nr:glycosyltransferase [Sulfuricella sp.]
MKISIITAVYNNRETVAAALDSALAQNHPDVELIVIDGGSTDGTLEVLHGFADRLAVLVSEPDKGIYDALNKGIQRASGDVVGFLHSDDLFADTGVLSHIEAAFADPGVEAVYGDLLYVRKDNPDQVVRYWRAGDFSRSRLSWGWMPPHPTFYVRRGVYVRLGGFDTSYRIAADYDCMLRFLGRGGVRVAYIPEVLVKMRLGGASNRSFRNIIQKSREDYRALRNNGIGGLATLLMKNFQKLPQFFTRPGEN